MISLIKTNQHKEAVSKISSAYEIEKKFWGENHYRTASILGLRGMAYIRMNRKEQALKDFSTAIPILVKKNDSKDTIITRLIIEEYIGLLADITAKPIEQKFEIDAIAEAFRLTGAIYKSSIQKALGASGARAAIRDPELAELVRQEQDTVQKIQAYEATIINALASSPDQQNHEAINNLKAKVMSLRDARVVLLNEIKNRFPKYSDFTNPKLTEIIAVQQLLHEQEALILIYTGIERTYVWAIPQKGKVHFDAVSLGNSELQIIVQHLRKALDPAALTFGDIPSFDLNQAHRLFAELLNPVNEGWKNAKDLIIVTPGPLGNLPFSILPAAPVKLSKDTDELFANYRGVPWLIRKVSISRQPSVSAFVTQRKLPKGDVSRKSFVGFGDPLFNKEQLAQAETEELKQKISLSNHEKTLHLRGIRITELGNLDSDEITTIHIDSLKRLPDTSKEIKSIATALGADPNQDIFLGKRASERQVKTMDLSDRSIIAFATHALISGDLDGLYQPALALSAPAVTGDDGDGLLTLDEILQLNLNARWVVLSACNTGAAQGAGEESVSGLGRAFFYAGTKAILVSMWPVETTSARKLTTALFQYQMENNKLSRARALRKSMLSLIDGPGFVDNASGKIVASYAHPIFWAPFIVVGDGT
jgi:CHAT domain-containing protein